MSKEEKNVKRSKFRTNITKKGLKRVNDKTMISLSLPGKKYDSTCKELFQNKEIIAPVLKAVVPEYKNSTVEEIIRYIDADSIKDIPVDAVSQRVTGLPTEMSSVSDKLIYYDTHFIAINPKLTNEQICIHLHFDLEIQNNYKPTNPKYPIIKRGVYYAAREISYQLGILTEQTNYADIQKVYSIWICNENVPQKLQNTVTMYSFKKEDIIGTTDEPEADYDLMNVIIIRRGEADDGLRNYEPIFDYLSGIFECDTMRVCKYVDISQNEAIKKGMADMKGLGQSIADKNLKKGIQRGEELKLIDLVCRKIVKGKDISQTADELEEEESTIKKICDAAMNFAPDFDVAKIYDTLHGK